jgi:hypothetical protein
MKKIFLLVLLAVIFSFNSWAGEETKLPKKVITLTSQEKPKLWQTLCFDVEFYLDCKNLSVTLCVYTPRTFLTDTEFLSGWNNANTVHCSVE